MKEDRKPWLHKLACTQKRKNHPNTSGDKFLTERPRKSTVTLVNIKPSQTQFQPQSQQKFLSGG